MFLCSSMKDSCFCQLFAMPWYDGFYCGGGTCCDEVGASSETHLDRLPHYNCRWSSDKKLWYQWTSIRVCNYNEWNLYFPLQSRTKTIVQTMKSIVSGQCAKQLSSEMNLQLNVKVGRFEGWNTHNLQSKLNSYKIIFIYSLSFPKISKGYIPLGMRLI